MSKREIELRYLAVCAVVREAGGLARRHFARRQDLEIEQKGLQDLVSLADRSVEDLIRTRLHAAFPDDLFVGEEGGAEASASAGGTWVIDPIDGTANFLHGVPYWSITVAYVRAGELLIGVTYDPVHDHLFAALRGRGAFRNGEPIRVSGLENPERTVVGHTFSFAKTEPAAYLRTIGALLEAGVDHRRLGSTALMMAHVADGRLDGCVTLSCSSWDVIGGLLLVREAGGLASDWLTKASLTGSAGVFGCTPALREVIERASGLTL